MNKSILVMSLGLFGLVGCSSQPIKSMPSEAVQVVTPDDGGYSCSQLEPKIENLEYDAAEMIKIKKQREKDSFALSTITSMTLAFLSAPSANNRAESNYGYSEKEAARLESLKQRHIHLVQLAEQKKCGFVDKVRARMVDNSQPDEEVAIQRKRNHY